MEIYIGKSPERHRANNNSCLWGGRRGEVETLTLHEFTLHEPILFKF